MQDPERNNTITWNNIRILSSPAFDIKIVVSGQRLGGDAVADIAHDDKQQDTGASEGTVSGAVMAHAEGVPLGSPASQRPLQDNIQPDADVRHSDRQKEAHAASGSVIDAVIAHPEDYSDDNPDAKSDKKHSKATGDASADVKHNDSTADVHARAGSVMDAVLVHPEGSEGFEPSDNAQPRNADKRDGTTPDATAETFDKSKLPYHQPYGHHCPADSSVPAVGLVDLTLHSWFWIILPVVKFIKLWGLCMPDLGLLQRRVLSP